MECSIRQPPPACEASARHCGAVRPLNGEVLVVAEHRPPSVHPACPTLHQVTQSPEDRGAAQDQTALTGDACGAGRLDQRLARGEVDVEWLLAEDGASRGQGLVHRGPVRRRRRADPDGVAALRPRPPHRQRPRPRRRRGRRQNPGPGARCWSCTATIVGLDDTAVDHRLEAQAVRPGDQTGPDESDAQHARRLGGGARTVSSSTGWRRHVLSVTGSAATRPASASMNRDATMTSSGDLVALPAPDGRRPAAADGEAGLGQRAQ